MKDLPEEELPPHIFRSGSAAYKQLRESGKPQSVLISGESGAGKTETTKLCMNVLAEVSGSEGHFTEMVLESGVVLEAFGNAKTVYNNNSSRFGKWCEVQFDKKGKMSACQIRSYLLEQSRIVSAAEGERAYHLYYFMLHGASGEERAQYRLLASPQACTEREALHHRPSCRRRRRRSRTHGPPVRGRRTRTPRGRSTRRGSTTWPSGRR
jgi:myosin heavy subunit